jgi:hypothetical protein
MEQTYGSDHPLAPLRSPCSRSLLASIFPKDSSKWADAQRAQHQFLITLRRAIPFRIEALTSNRLYLTQEFAAGHQLLWSGMDSEYSRLDAYVCFWISKRWLLQEFSYFCRIGMRLLLVVERGEHLESEGVGLCFRCLRMSKRSWNRSRRRGFGCLLGSLCCRVLKFRADIRSCRVSSFDSIASR